MLHVGGGLGDLVTHLLENLHVLLFSVLLGHTAGGNMVEVLEPLKVGAGDTATVGEHVGDDDDAVLGKVVLSGEGGGTVSTFDDNLGLNVFHVGHVNGEFLGSGDQDVTLFFHEL